MKVHIYDLADLPPKEAGAFWTALRDLPEGKILFLPRPEGKTLRMVQARASSVNGEHPREGYRIKTQQDHQRDGVWVWWERRP